MAYDGELEAAIEAVARRWKGLSRRKMFGGVGYLLDGNMAFARSLPPGRPASGRKRRKK